MRSPFFFDGNRLFIQKRAEKKYHCGGLIANICCSHPRVGESVMDAVVRRLNEECGIKGVSLTEQGWFIYRAVFDNGLAEYEADHILIEEIEEDIKEIPEYFGATKRIFLQGADGFAADYDVLMKTAELLYKYVPSVETIGGYARIDNFYDKTEEQLRNMAAAGFANPYIGVESGDDVVLGGLHIRAL